MWKERLFCLIFATMKELYVITPVKDSIESTLKTIDSVMASKLDVPFTYTIFNDFSTMENTRILSKKSLEMGFDLVNLQDLTTHPSPNYLMVLQMAQQEALKRDAALVIVESDVIVTPHTLQGLFWGALEQENAGICASVTVDDGGMINYPYKGAAKGPVGVYATRHHCSFCCSLLTRNLLEKFDFRSLDPTKNWYDVTISHESLNLGLCNYLFVCLPVIHRPHSSRPWKLLKYKNPLKYYFLKFTKGLDKI